jgi:hypothetical protein
MRIQTVNVIQYDSEGMQGIFSFSDDEEGNKEAEKLFRELAKENNLPDDSIECGIEDGILEMNDYKLYLVHSSYYRSSTFQPNEVYRQCLHCDHFADEDGHFDDGEQEYDHDPEPCGEFLSVSGWLNHSPGLFHEYEDGKIGPNSIHHSRRGKAN